MADGHKSNSISQELGTVCEWQQVIIVFNMTMTQEAHGKVDTPLFSGGKIWKRSQPEHFIATALA